MKLLWRIIIGYLGIILSLSYTWNFFGIEEFNVTKMLYGILSNMIFTVDLVNAYKKSNISRNMVINMMPITVVLIIFSNMFAMTIWFYITTSFWYRARKIYGIEFYDIVFIIMSLSSLVLIANRLFNYYKSKKA